jgi:hypothetical protein
MEKAVSGDFLEKYCFWGLRKMPVSGDLWKRAGFWGFGEK